MRPGDKLASVKLEAMETESPQVMLIILTSDWLTLSLLTSDWLFSG